jgi:hypothetical protein
MPRSSKWSLFLGSLHQDPACISSVSHTCHMPCPSHPSWFDHLVMQSSPLPGYPTLLGPNILLSTLFLNTLSLCSSFSVRGQPSHPYKTTGKITALYILIFIYLDRKLEDKWFCTEW